MKNSVPHVLKPNRHSVVTINTINTLNINVETSIDLSPEKKAISQIFEYDRNNFKEPKNSNIKVAVRFRPMNMIEQELLKNKIGYDYINLIDDKHVLLKQDMGREENFSFDKIFPINATQEDLYSHVGKELLNDVINGYNATILSYGQSSSGKTFTMYGDNIYDDSKKGIVPRTM